MKAGCDEIELLSVGQVLIINACWTSLGLLLQIVESRACQSPNFVVNIINLLIHRPRLHKQLNCYFFLLMGSNKLELQTGAKWPIK